MDYVISRLAIHTKPTSTPEILPDISCLVTGNVTSTCAANVTYRKLKITKRATTAGVSLSWDSEGVQQALPADYSITAAQIAIRKANGTSIYTASVPTGMYTIHLADFPVQIDMTLFIHTPCGTLRLMGMFSVSADTGSTDITFQLIDTPTGASSVTSVKDAIEIMAREICALKSRL